MSEYSSCLLQGYGVLAGPPLRLKAPLIAQHFAIVEWNPPKILPETVLSYNIHLRQLNQGEEYDVFEKDHSPFILENLESDTYYEAFVVAVNAHGKSAPSTRLVFKTKQTVNKEKSSSRICLVFKLNILHFSSTKAIGHRFRLIT